MLDDDCGPQASYNLQKLSSRTSSTNVTGMKLDLVGISLSDYLKRLTSGLVMHKAVLVFRSLILVGDKLGC